MFDIHRVELDWGGRTLTLEAGKIARRLRVVEELRVRDRLIVIEPEHADAHRLRVLRRHDAAETQGEY